MVFSCGQLSSILSTYVIAWPKLGEEIRRSSLKASSSNVTARCGTENLRERNPEMIQCLLSILNWLNLRIAAERSAKIQIFIFEKQNFKISCFKKFVSQRTDLHTSMVLWNLCLSYSRNSSFDEWRLISYDF